MDSANPSFLLRAFVSSCEINTQVGCARVLEICFTQRHEDTKEEWNG